jgi:multiple antibiotic resistance protein
MLEIAIRAFTTFFATVSPVDVAALFAALSASATARQRKSMAIKGVLIATVLLLLFTLFGAEVLRWMGITLPALRAAGGVLLLLMSIDMVFARPSGMTSTTVAETSEAATKNDISVFPLATPLIAGPGALGAAVLLTAETEGDLVLQAVVAAALLVVMAITLALLLIAGQVHRFLGVTGQNVITRVVGILLAALAVQFLFDGVRTSGLLS